MRTLALFLVVSCCLAGTGCTVLEGQRITLRYDAGQDRLQCLIHYDGIHDSRNKVTGSDIDQLRKFVSGGNVMFLDWFFHLNVTKLKSQSRPAGMSTETWAFMQALPKHMKVEQLGHYRDPLGHMGAAQLVTIEKASHMIRLANRALSRTLLDLEDEGGPWSRTLQKVKEAADRGHEWIALRGSAVEIRTPVHQDEWRRGKREFLRLSRKKADAASPASSHGSELHPDLWEYLLTDPLVSLVQGRQSVSVRIGQPSTATIVRLPLRPGYNSSLEHAVVENVPDNLDWLLAESLLLGTPPSDALAALMAWGPPEEIIRAMVSAARSSQRRLRKMAFQRLESMSRYWNADGRLPVAPDPDAPGFLEGWDRWYLDVVGQVH